MIEQHYLQRNVLHRLVLSLERALGGRNDEPENEGSHRCDESRPEFHDFLRAFSEMVFRQASAERYPEQRGGKDAHKDKQPRERWDHDEWLLRPRPSPAYFRLRWGRFQDKSILPARVKADGSDNVDCGERYTLVTLTPRNHTVTCKSCC